MTCARMHSHRTQNRDGALCVLALLVKVTHPQVARRSVRAEGTTTGVTRNAWSSGTSFFFFLPSRHGSAAKPCCGTRARSSSAIRARRSILDSVERTKPTSSSQHYQTRPKRREGRIRARPPAALPSANDVRRHLGRVFTGAGGRS